MLTEAQLDEFERECSSTYIEKVTLAYEYSRGVGHTEAAIKGLQNDESAFLVVAAMDQALPFMRAHPRPVAVTSLGQLQDVGGRAMVMDNSAIMAMGRQALELLSKTRAMIREHRFLREAIRTERALKEYYKAERERVLQHQLSYTDEARNTVERLMLEAKAMFCNTDDSCVHCHLLELAEKLKASIVQPASTPSPEPHPTDS